MHRQMPGTFDLPFTEIAWPIRMCLCVVVASHGCFGLNFESFFLLSSNMNTIPIILSEIDIK